MCNKHCLFSEIDVKNEHNRQLAPTKPAIDAHLNTITRLPFRGSRTQLSN